MHSPSHHCCRDQSLVLSVPPFSYSAFWTLNDELTEMTGGAVPEIFAMVGDELGASTSTVVASVVGSNPSVLAPDTYPCLGDGSCNIAVADLSAFESFNDTEYVYTAPFLTSYVTAVVPMRVGSPGGVWALMEPLSVSLWMALAVLAGCSATLLVLLVGLRDTSLRGSLSTLPGALYHVLAFMLGGEDYEWIGWPGRLLRLGLLWVVLVTQATYTANLAALSAQQSDLTQSNPTATHCPTLPRLLCVGGAASARAASTAVRSLCCLGCCPPSLNPY